MDPPAGARLAESFRMTAASPSNDGMRGACGHVSPSKQPMSSPKNRFGRVKLALFVLSALLGVRRIRCSSNTLAI
jgi:hypothetical protein